MSEVNWKELEFGALWGMRSGKGFSGQLSFNAGKPNMKAVSVMCFENRDYKQDKDPKWRVFLAPEKGNEKKVIWQLLEIGALWESDDKTKLTGGITFDSGKETELNVSLVCFLNKFKTEDRHPVWRVHLGPDQSKAKRIVSPIEDRMGYWENEGVDLSAVYIPVGATPPKGYEPPKGEVKGENSDSIPDIPDTGTTPNSDGLLDEGEADIMGGDEDGEW